jgi:hypothetical protein
MLGRDRHRHAEPQGSEIDEALLPLLDLVGDQQHRATLPAQRSGDGLVVGQPPGACIYKEHNEIGLVDRPLGLFGGRPQQGVDSAQEEASRIDQLERDPAPGGERVVAVSRGPRAAVDDRLAAARDPIEQRGLADVRAPYEGELGERDQFDTLSRVTL